ncbi:unnamed protein product, partial [Ectocarpus fasciculatus]
LRCLLPPPRRRHAQARAALDPHHRLLRGGFPSPMTPRRTPGARGTPGVPAGSRSRGEPARPAPSQTLPGFAGGGRVATSIGGCGGRVVSRRRKRARLVVAVVADLFPGGADSRTSSAARRRLSPPLPLLSPPGPRTAAPPLGERTSFATATLRSGEV